MDLEQIRSYTATDGRHVGDVVWWGLDGARIRRADLEAIWARAGLSPDLLPKYPTPEKAFKTAIRDAGVGLAEHLFELGKQDDDELVYALLRVERDSAGNVSTSQVARVRLDRHHTATLDSDEPDHELVRPVFTAYDQLLHTHTIEDVRRTLVKTLDACAAVTLRDHGGVYWVPADYSETLHRLQGAVAEIGQSRLDVLPVHASAAGREALGHAAHESIEAEIANLRLEIATFVADPPGRASTLVHRLERFEDLRQKAQLYHSILEVQVQDLEGALDELADTVRRLLDGSGAQAPAVAEAA
jgi:hypothetical protein